MFERKIIYLLFYYFLMFSKASFARWLSTAEGGLTPYN